MTELKEILKPIKAEFDELTKERNLISTRLREISEKINALESMLKAYGDGSTSVPVITEKPVIGNYPVNGSWKEKIIHVLQGFNSPLTADAIAQDIITAFEPTAEQTKVFGMVTQYTSTMAKNGELVVTGKEGKRNLYSIKA